MNKRKTHQTSKYLYKFSIEESNIIQFVIYDFDTRKIFIRVIRKPENPYNKTWTSVNRERIKRDHKGACTILKRHAKDLKDDPERLSTEFIQKLIGAK